MRKDGESTPIHPCTAAKKFVPGCHELKIFSGSTNPQLAEKIAHYLGTELAPVNLSTFADKEISIKIGTNVRGMDVYVVTLILN